MYATLDLCSPGSESESYRRGLLHENPGKFRLRDLLDISGTLTEAAGAVVDSLSPDPWNWNVYLFPLWCLGVVTRYLILFPVRLIIVAIGWIVFLSCYPAIHTLLKGHHKLRRKLEKRLLHLFCGFFVASWTGVIKYHGPRPSKRPGQVFVANHTSMIDYAILAQMRVFAGIMQKHNGWVGFMQRTILESLGCILFNRSEAKDREIVTKRLKEHVYGSGNYPLLIFPEGTCVNNQFSVMFKKGAFEIGCTVCPIAIKYNKIFSDAFWDSRKHSFTVHLFRIMTSWALVCDVYFLEPQKPKPGETRIEFAERVRDMICARAGLKKVDWDGFLKHSCPSPKLLESKQQRFAESLLQRMREN